LLARLLAGCQPILKQKFNFLSSQDDLAKKAIIKYTTLTKIESGVVNEPSVQTMAKIVKALGVSIEELIK
jgi:transcriptional regulator with XRE-family HTH domain